MLGQNLSALWSVPLALGIPMHHQQKTFQVPKQRDIQIPS